MRTVLAVVGLTLAAAGQAADIPWSKNFVAGMVRAKATKRLAMVEFYAEWCTWSKKLEAETLPDPRVVDFATKFVPVRLNAEREGKSAARKYGVRTTPTVLFIDSHGKVAHRIQGFLPSRDFVDQMQLAIRANGLPMLEERLRKDSRDMDALFNLVSIYAAQKRETSMLGALRRFRAAQGSSSPFGARTFQAVGDYYQLNGDPKRAIPYFREASKSANSAREVAYSLISEAACHLAVGDKAAAVPVLERVLAMGSGASDFTEAARRMLRQAKG